MPTRPTFSITDKSSTVAGVAGATLAAELATQAYPESHNKRQWYNLRPLAATSGATAAEAFIDGIQGFRWRLAERSTCLLKVFATYNNNAAANNTAFEITVAAQNVGGTITILGTQLQVKYPGASTASIVFTADSPTQSLICTVTGVAGDANGQWDIRIGAVSEVTDIG